MGQFFYVSSMVFPWTYIFLSLWFTWFLNLVIFKFQLFSSSAPGIFFLAECLCIRSRIAAWFMACSNADFPALFLTFMLALPPRLSKTLTMSMLPVSTLRCNAVWPRRSCKFTTSTDAAESNASTTSRWPFWHAKWRGVWKLNKSF